MLLPPLRLHYPGLVPLPSHPIILPSPKQPLLLVQAINTYYFHLFQLGSSAMEIFQKAKTVRLRSHHDKYLLADDDRENVYQERDGTVDNAKWTVELLDSKPNHIRLKSCYGKYLTASNMPFLLGFTGEKVLQTLPTRLNSSLEWEPIRDGLQIKLRTRYGQYLRANGGLPPWRNHITHNVPHRTITQDWILWDVVIAEYRRPNYTPPSDAFESSEISITDLKMSMPKSDELCYISPSVFEGRVINYGVVDDSGEIDEAIGERSFNFKGSGVEELKLILKQEAGVNEDICICSRSPLNGKLYPLRLHLPPNRAAMNVVVVPLSSKVAAELEIHRTLPP